MSSFLDVLLMFWVFVKVMPFHLQTDHGEDYICVLFKGMDAMIIFADLSSGWI